MNALKKREGGTLVIPCRKKGYCLAANFKAKEKAAK